MVFSLHLKRGTKYMCVSLAARDEARYRQVVPYDSITLSLNKKDSLKCFVILLHIYSMQLIFYDSS